MKKVMSILTASGPALKSQVVSSLPSGVPIGPAASRSAITSTTSSPAKGAPAQITKPILAHSRSEKRTAPVQFEPTAAEAPKASLTGAQQLVLNPPGGSASRRDLRTPPPTTSIRTISEGTESYPQSVAPGRLSAQLAQMWAVAEIYGCFPHLGHRPVDGRRSCEGESMSSRSWLRYFKLTTL